MADVLRTVAPALKPPRIILEVIEFDVGQRRRPREGPPHLYPFLIERPMEVCQPVGNCFGDDDRRRASMLIADEPGEPLECDFPVLAEVVLLPA